MKTMLNPKLTVAAITIAGLSALALPALAAEFKPLPVVTAAAQVTAPEFTGITTWLNSEPLTMAQLRGKVVLVNFWTYGCYNCINTLPHVTALQAKYGNSGFTVIGVHTPEFAHEKSAANVAAAIKQHGITYPVAQDNGFATWKAYDNHYWPAQYIVDQTGKIVFQHAGEGQYDEIEQTIQNLLKANS
jgi:thiol-disulfide isomerase/thioredoxin